MPSIAGALQIDKLQKFDKFCLGNLAFGGQISYLSWTLCEKVQMVARVPTDCFGTSSRLLLLD